MKQLAELSSAVRRCVAGVARVARRCSRHRARPRGHGATSGGTEYDQGGGTSRRSTARCPTSTRIADQITRSTARDGARSPRTARTLPYGDITPARRAARRCTTYPGAGRAARVSDQYAVSACAQRGRSTPSFVYQVAARKTDTNLEEDTSWTSFSFAGAVTVARDASSPGPADRLPGPPCLGARSGRTFAGDTCTFTLTRAANVSVEFDPEHHNPVLHPMLVFANPPEVDVPPARRPERALLRPRRAPHRRRSSCTRTRPVRRRRRVGRRALHRPPAGART